MGNDGSNKDTQLSVVVPFRPGMEVEPAVFTPPEIRPGPPQRERYRSPRFTRPVRVVWTVGILALPAFLVWVALGQLLMAEGRARAAFAIPLFPVVPMCPIVLRAMRDLWGWER